VWKGLLLLQNVTGTLRLALRLLLDRRVPFSLKLLLPAAIVYFISPIDFVPDFFPALGRLDDILVLLLSLFLFLALSPSSVVREYLNKMGIRGWQRASSGPSNDSKGKVIEVPYRFVDEQREP